MKRVTTSLLFIPFLCQFRFSFPSFVTIPRHLPAVTLKAHVFLFFQVFSLILRRKHPHHTILPQFLFMLLLHTSDLSHKGGFCCSFWFPILPRCSYTFFRRKGSAGSKNTLKLCRVNNNNNKKENSVFLFTFFLISAQGWWIKNLSFR